MCRSLRCPLLHRQLRNTRSLLLLLQVLQGVLSTFLETAKLLAAEQTRADEAKFTERIDGRKDVQELVERNAHRVQVPAGHATRARGHGDAVGEASILSVHHGPF